MLQKKANAKICKLNYESAGGKGNYDMMVVGSWYLQ